MHPKFKEAINFHKNGDLKKVNEICLQILKGEPRNFDVLHLLGITSYQINKFEKSIEYFERAIKVKSNNSEIYNNLGIALKKINKKNEALEKFDQAIKINNNYFEAYNNRANVYIELNKLDKALTDFNKVIELKPNLAEAYNNRGNVKNQLKKFDDALEDYNKAIQIKPNFAEAYNNKAIILNDNYKFKEAIENYTKAIEINPNINFLLGSLMFLKLNVCDWKSYSEDLNLINNKIIENLPVSTPWSFLHFSNSPDLQKKNTEIFIKKKYSHLNISQNLIKKNKNKKIRLGYYSADFRNHAISYLTANLFEEHDREKFEIFAFSFGPNVEDKMKNRIKNSVDKFYDVSFKNDHEISSLSKDLEIDIAIDLMGFTEHNRFGIFLKRCAPIQINYLGYAGTLGCKNIDYIIADKILIPEENQKFYTEKIIYMPDTYQSNDAKKIISKKKFTKTEFGLPENSFVLCCFNKNYKITPSTFIIWMNLLKNINNSVLWLIKDNTQSNENLKIEASKNGINPDRIVFAERMPMEEHIARQKLANLFIDTFPYTAHTTCSDALRIGLPVVTRIGNTFASRVAASLLNTVDLNELVTNNENEYELKIIELAKNPLKLKEINKKLNENIQTKSLYNTKLFTKNLEKAFIEIHKKFLNNLPPDNIIL